jgi:hypothetical protein
MNTCPARQQKERDCAENERANLDDDAKHRGEATSLGPAGTPKQIERRERRYEG